jgi:hypothetical protein
LPNLIGFFLEPFTSLESLTLNRCPPSTILDLYSFRHQIIKLEILDAGIPKLSELLAPIKSKYLRYPPLLLLGESRQELRPSPRQLWSKLSILHLCNCGLTRLDSSLHLTPHLIQLDVSHNDLQHIIHLYHSSSLTSLNLSYNRLRVLSNSSLVIPHIRRLNLSHNLIESLDGLDKLSSLERLDLSHNKINDLTEFTVLIKLKHLTHLYATGNPIANKSNYRLHLLTLFLHEASLNGRFLPTLDGVTTLSSEEMTTLYSSIFLPPEVLETSEEMTLHHFQSSALLIGGTLLKPDDVPIHELDKLFATESRKFRTADSPISGLISTPAAGTTTTTLAKESSSSSSPIPFPPTVTFTREKIRNYCKLRSLKRQRGYQIRTIQHGEDQPVTPIDMNSVMRATSISSMRHSNETLVFSDAGIHLLEFEDLEEENLEQLSPSPERGRKSPLATSTSRSTTSAESVVGMSATGLPRRSIDSLSSSVDHTVATTSGSQNGSVRSNNSSRFHDTIESKSCDSADHLVPRSLSYLSDEVPDLSILMQQMAKVSASHPISSPTHSYSVATQQSISQSAGDGNHLKILMDLMHEEDPENSPASIEGFEKPEGSSQKICDESTSLSISPESANHSNSNANGKRTRQGRWGTTKPPLNSSDLKLLSSKSSFSHYRSSSPTSNSVQSENWETKPTSAALGGPPHLMSSRSNCDTQTDISSVYSGEDTLDLNHQMSNAPTTTQIAHMFTRASQEEAKRFASLANQHYLQTNNAPVQSYTGSLDYEYLSVSENLEKYFQEQVFGNSRPSREAPYMRREHRDCGALVDEIITPSGPTVDSSSQEFPSHRCYGNTSRFSYLSVSDNPLEILYVDIPYQPETLVSVFRVKVLDLSNLNQASGGAGIGREGEDEMMGAIPQPLVFVVTTINLYVIIDNFFTNAIFADAPLPVLRRVHPIDSLRSCIVYFGFQRCVFQFRDDDINPLHRKRYLDPSGGVRGSSGHRQATTSYMIVTNDKSLTSPLITTLPTVANQLRQERELPKVFRDNYDSQFLDQVTKLIRVELQCENDETDVVYSQLVYQLWAHRPGVLVPRTLIITPMLLLLCHEEMTSINVSLRLIDSVRLTNISRVRPETDPLKVTIVMKPEGALSFKKRKWKLMADSPSMIMKIRDEVRKTAQDAKVSLDC